MITILISHIIIATSSVVFTGFVFISPSKNKLNAAYMLVALTVLTGTALVVFKPADLAQVCKEGLVYLAVVFVGIYAAHRRLVKRLTAKPF